MSSLQLLWRSLLYYWRTNLAVVLGVFAGTAVIGGALIVGDSVRGSLETMSRERLGEIDYALSSHRFLTQDIAEKVSDEETTVAPALVMVGALERKLGEDSDDPRYARAGQVNVYGLTDELWSLTNHGDAKAPLDDQVLVSSRLAEQLAKSRDGVTTPLKAGDSLILWIELPTSIPRDTLLGDREEQTSVSVELVVSNVLPERSGVGRLELTPSQQLPLNAFVNLETLQNALGLEARTERKRDPVARKIFTTKYPARINALFVGTYDETTAETAESLEFTKTLNEELKANLSFKDLSLRIDAPSEKSYFSLESEQQILSNEIANAAEAAAKELNLPTQPVLVYISNKMANADDQKVELKSPDNPGRGYSMYSIIAGVDVASGEASFPNFEFVGGPAKSLGEDDIILSDWLAKDLEVSVGDEIRVTYYQVGGHILGAEGKLPEEETTLTVRGIVRLNGLADDPDLVPEVPGITDVVTFSDIEDNRFPVIEELITDRDELFWDDHPATPKAFMSLAGAQKLWKSRYGQLTSFRVGIPEGSDAEAIQKQFQESLLKHLDIQRTGLAFRPVKFQGLQAASGTTDFSGLFFGFSFFLILSATILIGLLFRLGIERRAKQIGLLAAVGYSPGEVRGQFLREGGILVLVGGVLGIGGAIAYAKFMVYGLKTWWVGAIGTRFLDVYLTPMSLLLGFAISVVITLITIWWALRQLKKLSSRDLLVGVVEPTEANNIGETKKPRSRLLALSCGGFSVVMLIAALLKLIPSSEAFMGISWTVVAFFLVGMAMLTAGLSLLSWMLASDALFAVRGTGIAGTSRLGMRNAARSRLRSVLTVGLIASATFVIVAVAAGHRNPAVESPDFDSGNGGFRFVAESSTPINYDLNTPAGREKTSGRLTSDATSRELLAEAKMMPFRVKPGENASCLNLYQTQLPTVLGATDAMIERGGFKFIGADREKPWTLLEEPIEDATLETPDGESITVPAYPVFGDMNTLQYSLHKAVGDMVAVPNESAPVAALKIVGMFDGSIFQGVLVSSENDFNHLFPEQAGYRYFLIETPDTDSELSNVLESGLRDYGFDVESIGRRLQNFLEVQNTYLSTFQALGGLGLLLGTLGLATVMLRNVLERRSELALLRAVGFLKPRLTWLVLCENAFLLVWGLVTGTVSALVAMSPHLVTIGADVPWGTVAVILVAVTLTGMLAAFFAIFEAVRTPVLSTLRAE